MPEGTAPPGEPSARRPTPHRNVLVTAPSPGRPTVPEVLALRDRTTALVACVLAAVLAAGIYLISKDWHGDRKIPTVRGVSITAVGSPADHAVAVPLGRTKAQELADILNRLGAFPSGQVVCANADASAYLLDFTTARGSRLTARVAIGGCLDVDVQSDGSWWNWGKWDPDDVAKNAIRRDLGT